MIKSEDEKQETSMQPCSCIQDPFAALPPELMPKPAAKRSLLRDVTCPGCGKAYQTNRKTNLCMDCEKKGVRLPEPPVIEGG